MDVREKLIGILRKPIFPHELVDPTEAVADYLLDSGVTVREWIPVTERLPDKKGVFLVYVKTQNKWGGYIKTTWFTTCYEGVEDHMQGKKIWYDYDSDFGDYEVRNVTHWMPLPEPPKGE